jgi:hypothetical protein
VGPGGGAAGRSTWLWLVGLAQRLAPGRAGVQGAEPPGFSGPLTGPNVRPKFDHSNWANSARSESRVRRLRAQGLLQARSHPLWRGDMARRGLGIRLAPSLVEHAAADETHLFWNE